MNILVVGDLHLQEREPKKSQTLHILQWIADSQHNNENTILLLLGDLVESINSIPELLEVYVDLFLNQCRYKEIWILQGNHDCSIQSTILSTFRPIKKVKIITKLEEKMYGNTRMLFLPHYKHEGTTLPKLKDYYSSLTFPYEFDYCFSHVSDETIPGQECNLSQLKVKQYLSGHSHHFNIDKGGHYLGSAVLNSKAETGKTPYAALINATTAKYELIELPKTLEYYEVHYPEELPTISTHYGLFTVFDSIDREETLKYYQSQAKEKNINFFPLKIIRQKTKEEELLFSQKNDTLKTDKEYFDDYVKLYSVNEEISKICREIIKEN
jgi:predicted phosphodiesterase